MPKVARELSDAAVRKLSHGKVQGIGNTDKKPGAPCPAYHAVGGVAGLLLCCKPSGSRSWILRTKVGEVRRAYLIYLSVRSVSGTGRLLETWALDFLGPEELTCQNRKYVSHDYGE